MFIPLNNVGYNFNIRLAPTRRQTGVGVTRVARASDTDAGKLRRNRTIAYGRRMNELPTDVTDEDHVFATIAIALVAPGYVVLPAALPPALVDALGAHVRSLAPDRFKPAGIGRGVGQQSNATIRGDAISWLDTDDGSVRGYLAWMERLRAELNRRLYLGLFDYESHAARYPSGAFYKRHVDAFKGDANRVVTTLLYLNPQWDPTDGGELLLYDPAGDNVLERVLPIQGKLVVFLSEDFPHEVLAARRTRYSVAGWFRVNPTSSHVLSPSR